MRIALIHATPLAIDPVQDAFARHWPEAEVMNILDDHLSVDRAAEGLTDRITSRIAALADYGLAAGADGILFTCSAFGPAIDTVSRSLDVPALKPNEAMFTDAVTIGGQVGLVASFAPSLPSMEAEFAEMAGSDASLETVCAPDAMPALAAGDGAAHDRLLAAVAQTLGAARTIMLAQFSNARAAQAVATATGKTVLTSPDSAVRALHRRLTGE